MINKLKIKNQDGVVQEYDLGGGGGDSSIELTLEEFLALPEDERNNGTYYITDANLSGGIPNAVGTLKPWLYSEEETIVGVYEGKPLYRKVLTIDNPAQSAYVGINYTSDDVDKAVSANGVFRYKIGDGSIWGNTISPTTGTFHLSFRNDLKDIEYNISDGNASSEMQLIITVEYTKVADKPGSGNGLMPYGYIGKGIIQSETVEVSFNSNGDVSLPNTQNIIVISAVVNNRYDGAYVYHNDDGYGLHSSSLKNSVVSVTYYYMN